MVVEPVEVEEPLLEALLRGRLERVRLRLLPRVAHLVVVPVHVPVLHAQPAELVVAVPAEDAAAAATLHTHTAVSPGFWRARAEMKRLLAAAVLLDVVLALRAGARVRLDPLRRPRVLARVLEPRLHELADDRPVVGVEAAPEAEGVRRRAPDGRHGRREGRLVRGRAGDGLGAAGVGAEAELRVRADVRLPDELLIPDCATSVCTYSNFAAWA